ncbi:tRNA pseudouridine(38-40) synthase TruA [Candidatus Babeliales bacterium]|nr:tRNA pseudouridine(38-40) synthase TruA [Candidatus Babeliales bacterium]
MQYFKIVIAYDGTDFCGWQTQLDKPTVCTCMQKAFYKTFKQKISLVGASRTDSGVHAIGQVAKFRTELNLKPKIILNAWNSILPKSILIRQVEKIDNNFHPCKNVLQKTYYYNFFLKRPLPFVSRYGWFCNYVEKIDLEKFERALNLYIGEHDFRSFCKIDIDENKNPIRKIDFIGLQKYSKHNLLQVVIKGKSFLRFQIRRMVGYALDVARRPDLSIDYLKNILDKPSPHQKLLKAESCGLILRKIDYKYD